MDLIAWNDSMSVGMARVDDQHKKLIAMINELHSAMLEAKGTGVMGRLFEDLAEYTATHFRTEEDLMDSYGYPAADTEYHKREHAMLVDQVGKLKARFAAGELALSLEVMNFLRDWLTGHIMDTDAKLRPFFKEKGLS